MTVTLWDSFEYLLQDAEEQFLRFNFDKAVENWNQYYKITAKTEYRKIITEIKDIWANNEFTNIATLSRLFELLQVIKNLYNEKRISSFTYQIFKKLIIKIYIDRFKNETQNQISVERGAFECLTGQNDLAVKILNQVINKDFESLQARIYLGYAYMAQKEHQLATAVLTQNLFLAADQIKEDELYISQFKLLLGRLNAKYADRSVSSWMLAFESWYRNWLIIKEDSRFFSVIRKKETNERILQVKYFQNERYRHFIWCLYITEYARFFLEKEKGLVIEQESYMEKLDKQLYDRYKKKRKS